MRVSVLKTLLFRRGPVACQATFFDPVIGESWSEDKKKMMGRESGGGGVWHP